MLGFGNRRQTPEDERYARSYSPRQSAEQAYPQEGGTGYAYRPQAAQGGAPAQGMPMPAGAAQTARMSQQGPADPELAAYIDRRAAEIDAQVREFSLKNPDFDIRRELRNPKFCNYLWGNGLSVEDAYYLTHRGETEERAARPAPEKRIAENGTSKPGGSGVVKKNPEDMSDEEVDDIIRRVRKGEKISF